MEHAKGNKVWSWGKCQYKLSLRRPEIGIHTNGYMIHAWIWIDLENITKSKKNEMKKAINSMIQFK